MTGGKDQRSKERPDRIGKGGCVRVKGSSIIKPGVKIVAHGRKVRGRKFVGQENSGREKRELGTGGDRAQAQDS